MGQELFNDGAHCCLVFRHLVGQEAVQANQILVCNHGQAALLDPGGDLTYAALAEVIGDYLRRQRGQLRYVIASHQDPDVIASVHRWLEDWPCRIVVPSLWERFVPHLLSLGKLADRLVPIPDGGLNLRLGQGRLQALPAHFLHAEGNFSLYDPISRILFSGDIGANFPPHGDLDAPVTRFEDIRPFMEGFHRRYMNANRACRYWVHMIRELEIDLLVPQHGRALQGSASLTAFLDWFEHLECGVDLVTQALYRRPVEEE